MAEQTVTVEQMGKEVDRQMAHNARLNEEIDAISEEMYALLRRLTAARSKHSWE